MQKNFGLDNISPTRHYYYISLKVTYLELRNKDLSNQNPTSIVESQQYPIILHGAAAAAAADLPRAGLSRVAVLLLTWLFIPARAMSTNTLTWHPDIQSTLPLDLARDDDDRNKSKS